MISTKEVKVKISDNLTSDYIESELKKMGFDILRWAITGYVENYFLIDVSIIEE